MLCYLCNLCNMAKFTDGSLIYWLLIYPLTFSWDFSGKSQDCINTRPEGTYIRKGNSCVWFGFSWLRGRHYTSNPIFALYCILVCGHFSIDPLRSNKSLIISASHKSCRSYSVHCQLFQIYFFNFLFVWQVQYYIDNIPLQMQIA